MLKAELRGEGDGRKGRCRRRGCAGAGDLVRGGSRRGRWG